MDLIWLKRNEQMLFQIKTRITIHIQVFHELIQAIMNEKKMGDKICYLMGERIEKKNIISL